MVDFVLMKQTIKLGIVLVLAAVVFSAVYLFLSTRQLKLVTPVLSMSKLSISDNLWFPKRNENVLGVLTREPEITAKSAFFVELTSGNVLYEKNAFEKLPIASLVKIMTAIIVLENDGLRNGRSFVVSERASSMEPDKMLLIEGETLSTWDLMAGLFLVSANDASEVFAENVTGKREEFISLMNLKAERLGMKNTRFINPSGLMEDGKSQYSTAYDVALMSRFAINKWPELLEITSNPHIYIPRTENHQDYDLYSGINLLASYPGVVGFKTGYTPEAGLTLVTVAKRGEKVVLGVILDSLSRRDDAKELLDYSFAKLGLLAF